MQKFCEKCTFSMLATELIQSFLAEDLQKRIWDVTQLKVDFIDAYSTPVLQQNREKI